MLSSVKVHLLRKQREPRVLGINCSTWALLLPSTPSTRHALPTFSHTHSAGVSFSTKQLTRFSTFSAKSRKDWSRQTSANLVLPLGSEQEHELHTAGLICVALCKAASDGTGIDTIPERTQHSFLRNKVLSHLDNEIFSILLYLSQFKASQRLTVLSALLLTGVS